MSCCGSFLYLLSFKLFFNPFCFCLRQMNSQLRPSFSQIVVELERRQAERKQKAEPTVKGEPSILRTDGANNTKTRLFLQFHTFHSLFFFFFFKAESPALGLLRRRSLCHPSDPRLSRSKSDMLHPLDAPPSVAVAIPARVNPFSQREDLNGGKIKLFDTPSKSVLSLTFTLPPPPDCDDPSGGRGLPRRHRRCRSLPCTPLPHLASAPNAVLTEESTAELDTANDETSGTSGEERLSREEKDSGEGSGADSGLPLSLEPLSLDLLEEKEEEEVGGEEEPMDCSSSPNPQDGTSSPYPKLSPSPVHTSTPLQSSNGWGSAISNGPPCLPPLSHLDNNNVVVSRPSGRRAADGTTTSTTTNNNGYRSPPGDPGGSSPFGSGSRHSLDQEEEVVSCPGCCLAGLRFPSLCLRAPARRNLYKNLNGDHAASRGLLCPAPKGLPPSPTPPTTTTTSLEPGLALPGAQT